jgi:hypothetical protein
MDPHQFLTIALLKANKDYSLNYENLSKERRSYILEQEDKKAEQFMNDNPSWGKDTAPLLSKLTEFGFKLLQEVMNSAAFVFVFFVLFVLLKT